MISSLTALYLLAQSAITVLVNGEPVTFADQAPAMAKQRVLVPVRGVFEHLNATVVWNAGKEQVLATQDGKNIELYIGKTVAIVDGRELQLDQPPMLMNGRAMVPLRFLSESLGANVKWNAEAKRVEITTRS